MPKQEPQNTTDGVARKKANLHPNPHTLKRGGKKPRTILTIPELEFASWLAQGSSVADAARFAGIPFDSNTYTLARKPRIRAHMDKLIKEYGRQAQERVSNLREKMGTFVVGEWQHRTRTAVTHLDRGDQDIRNMLRDGMEAALLVQPKSGPVINANAAAGAANSFQPLYRPAKVQEVREVGRQAFQARVESEAAVIEGHGELGT